MTHNDGIQHHVLIADVRALSLLHLSCADRWVHTSQLRSAHPTCMHADAECACVRLVHVRYLCYMGPPHMRQRTCARVSCTACSAASLSGTRRCSTLAGRWCVAPVLAASDAQMLGLSSMSAQWGSHRARIDLHVLARACVHKTQATNTDTVQTSRKTYPRATSIAWCDRVCAVRGVALCDEGNVRREQGC